MSDEPTLRALMLVEEPDSGDILRCVFGLHERDVDTYLALRATGRPVRANSPTASTGTARRWRGHSRDFTRRTSRSATG